MRNLRRWFWLIPFTTVVLAAWLAADGTCAVIAAELARDGPSPAQSRPARAVAAATAGTAQRDKDAGAVIQRNIFCSTCAPEAPPAHEEAPVADARPPLTALPLVLIAIFNGDGESSALATVADARTGRGGLYAAGEQLPGVGSIRRIGERSVELWNESTARVERIDLVPAAAAPAVSRATSAPPAAALAAADPRIRRIDDRHFEIERGLIEEMIADPARMKSTRLVPSARDGQAGFKLLGVRDDSPVAQIGLQNGDVIRAVNGLELSSPDKLLEAFGKLRSASSLAFTIARGGGTVELAYAIR